ncbi:MAG: hypothetical protein A2901_04415 [Elusimicrobia bacterium RIFCSPLOWO2_01_FULL_54_10]|nr:MAG: hypothetical protein A2901_04415 [Elusimicrobia bacterium RIFCSPLOWO2_01_FULL_54_10]
MLASCDALRAQVPPNGSEFPKNPNWIRSSVVYQIYPRTFSPEGKLFGVENELMRIKNLGATCLLILPVATDDLSTVKLEFGTKDNLKSLVEQAHFNEIRVILAFRIEPDAVPEKMKHGFLSWIKSYSLDGIYLMGASSLPKGFLEELSNDIEKFRPSFVLAVDGLGMPGSRLGSDPNFYGTVSNSASGAMPVSFLPPILEEDSRRPAGAAVPLRFLESYDNPRSAALLGAGAKAGAVLLFTLDGVPMLCAGQEIGETHQHSIDSKEVIDWKAGSKKNGELRKFFKQLIHFRKSHPSLARGQKFRIPSKGSESAFAFAASYRDDAVLVAVNLSASPVDAVLELPAIFYSAGGKLTLKEALGNGKLDRLGEDSSSLRLPPWGFMIWESK